MDANLAPEYEATIKKYGQMEAVAGHTARSE